MLDLQNGGEGWVGFFLFFLQQTFLIIFFFFCSQLFCLSLIHFYVFRIKENNQSDFIPTFYEIKNFLIFKLKGRVNFLWICTLSTMKFSYPIVYILDVPFQWIKTDKKKFEMTKS